MPSLTNRIPQGKTPKPRGQKLGSRIDTWKKKLKISNPLATAEETSFSFL